MRNEFWELLWMLAALLVISAAIALSRWASRAVTRRLPQGDDLVHPRIKRLRTDSFWPALRRGAHIIAVFGAVISAVAAMSLAGAIAAASLLGNLATSLRGFAVILFVFPIASALLTLIVWICEQVVHLVLDGLDVGFRRVMPPDSMTDTERTSTGLAAPTE
jgi:hypothetical protein